jgi:polysaccharide chain length determinant protein (PEP-CTERM system associated)
MEALWMLVRRYGAGVWQHRWLALGFTWLVCMLGWAGVAFVPNQYEASARLYVDADAVLTPLLHGLAADSSTVTELEVLQNTLLSRPNLDKVISGTGLGLQTFTTAVRQTLLKRLGAEIKITPQTRNLFTISYIDREPKLAYDVVQKLITIFIESATGNNRAEMDNAQQFIEQQIASYEAKLREAEKRRADFRAKNFDQLPADHGASRLEMARNLAQGLQGQLQDAVARRDLLLQQLKTTDPLLVTESEMAAAGGSPGSQLAAAEHTLQELRLRYTEQFPDVVAARRLVEMLKAHGEPRATPAAGGAKRTRSMPNGVYEQIRIRLIDAEATVASLERQLAAAVAERNRLEASARTEPSVQAEYVNIDRDYSVLRENYEALLSRRESMRIAEAADNKADKVRLRIVDPPQLPRNPVAPNRMLLISGVLLAGLGAGGGLAFLLMRFDETFYTVHDLRAFGLPVLGGISLLGPRMQRRAPALLGFSLGVLLLFAIYGGWLMHPLWITRLV